MPLCLIASIAPFWCVMLSSENKLRRFGFGDMETPASDQQLSLSLGVATLGTARLTSPLPYTDDPHTATDAASCLQFFQDFWTPAAPNPLPPQRTDRGAPMNAPPPPDDMMPGPDSAHETVSVAGGSENPSKRRRILACERCRQVKVSIVNWSVRGGIRMSAHKSCAQVRCEFDQDSGDCKRCQRLRWVTAISL